MIIDITNIPTLWFGGIKPTRKEKLLNTLSSLNIKNEFVEPLVSNEQDKAYAIKISHQRAIKRSLDFNSPVLILEDDIAPTSNFSNIFDIPDDADALYLGTCVYGLVPDWKYRPVSHYPIWLGQPENLGVYKNLYRISNMLCAHAIIYISKKYKEFCFNTIEYCVLENLPVDVLLADIMKKFNVYAVDSPVFFQDSEEDNYDAFEKTQIPLKTQAKFN